MTGQHHKSFDFKILWERTENYDEGHGLVWPHTPMTCNPHRTTKTARVWNNAIRPAYGYARQPMPES